VLELETLHGRRIVASPEAIDAIVSVEGVVDRGLMIRLAPDDAFLMFDNNGIEVDDGGIVVPETGFAGCWLTEHEVASRVLPHIEWSVPAERPALVQGLIAGVPAKLWLNGDESLLFCAAPYADELSGRLR
jgi:hypothetical protein